MSTTTEILTLIDALTGAELEGDADAYADLLAPDFLGIGPVGFTLNAEQWAGRHRGDLTNHVFTVKDPHVREYGDAVIVDAVQTQRTTARGMDTSGSFRLTMLAVRTGGRWTIAHIQLSGPLLAQGQIPNFARPVNHEASRDA